mmetsp:Transcript_26662/g.78474  ORF Transcript_26662/g.78474 Transcript_26662/m.78474 type:complete len:354 (+) Transcript_26662:536-1597(+)
MIQLVKDQGGHLVAGEMIGSEAAQALGEHQAFWLHKVVLQGRLVGATPCREVYGSVRVVVLLVESEKRQIEYDDRTVQECHRSDAHGRRGTDGSAQKDGYRVAHVGKNVELGEQGKGDAVHHVDVHHDEPLEEPSLQLVVGGFKKLAQSVSVHCDDVYEGWHHDSDRAKRRAGKEHGCGEVYEEAPHHNTLDQEVSGLRCVPKLKHHPCHWSKDALHAARDDVGHHDPPSETSDNVLWMDCVSKVESDHKDIEKHKEGAHAEEGAMERFRGRVVLKVLLAAAQRAEERPARHRVREESHHGDDVDARHEGRNLCGAIFPECLPKVHAGGRGLHRGHARRSLPWADCGASPQAR